MGALRRCQTYLLEENFDKELFTLVPGIKEKAAGKDLQIQGSGMLLSQIKKGKKS